MGRIEKTVFISYRRTNLPWALCIYQDLTSHGYDVFFDYLSIDSGSFEKVILENIKAHAHFLVILTPSALERCKEPNDWLRREIETAVDEKRNIVPLMLEGFDFGSSATKEALTGKLSVLNTFNGMSVYSEYFFEAMDKLRNRFLSVALENVQLHPLTVEAKDANATQRTAASEAPQVEKETLTAQEWFERGYVFGVDIKNPDEAIRCFSEAIRLKPDFAEAYNNRSVARTDNGDLDGAIRDAFEAIHQKPDLAMGYYNLGRAQYKKKMSLDIAIENFTKTLRLDSNYVEAYVFRGLARRQMGNLEEAITDLNSAISLKPNYYLALYNRGRVYEDKGNFNKAIADYNKAIRLKPDYDNAYYARALIREKNKKFRAAVLDYQKYLELGGGVRNGDEKRVKRVIQNLKKKIK